MKRILVTGASGFVGEMLCSTLVAKGYEVCAAVRSEGSILPGSCLDVVAVGEVGARTDWSAALLGVDCVMHCAARAHVLGEKDALMSYRRVNVDGTGRLVKQAAEMEVRRIVFVSSIKVNGEQTGPGAPFLFDDAPAPQDPYGVSKFEAEQALWEISAKTGLEVVVVRPPLVYGPKVKGNLLRLLRRIDCGALLPIGAVNNKRSFIGLSNLIDLLVRCIEHPAAPGQTLLVSDGCDLSTPQLIKLIAEGMGRQAHMIAIPAMLLQAGGFLLGRSEEASRLVGSLQVDGSQTQLQLGWTPPVSIEDGIREMARWYSS